ncbi:DUF5358 domain-containing protein [Aggregatibacter actinomycetemcomitans]|uniref:DUF5358 domain-containing protein n=1 Tax=Aggregatibacter actinomycetemcomitans TaxID=714 RepID=UPI00037F1B95|nr:DUF5358 domain-containing protein [Aggregatibacter actinomycetemcomitans]MCE3057098.1 DUF5358 domain-containing protein [Aggregatibacter actinomycetemcomitans]TYB27314.1 hypothetical protein FXB66_04965 [Aggregatibacter actinomycetemcomitans]
MLKKVIFSVVTLLLVGCADDPITPIPGEFAGADYLLSDIDAKRWAFDSKQAEQCIYPNLTRIQKEHFSREDTYIYSQYILLYPLENIIGEKYLKIIQNDEKSMLYATYQYKKFKFEEVEYLDHFKCQTLRTNARDDLDVVKGKYKNGVIEEKKTEGGENSDQGVATSENRFFFDIIKWGTTLLL